MVDVSLIMYGSQLMREPVTPQLILILCWFSTIPLWENIRNKTLGKAVLKWNENTLNLWPCKYFGELKRLKLRDDSVNVKSSVFKISEINIKILSYILDHCEESLSGKFSTDTLLFLVNHTFGLLSQLWV